MWQVGGRQTWQWLHHTACFLRTQFPWQERRFLSTDIGPLMRSHSAEECVTHRGSMYCVKGWQCSLFHRQLRTQAHETPVLLCSQLWSSVGLPWVLDWKFRGFCLVGVAGVQSQASSLDVSALLQGRLVLPMCCDGGSVCISSMRLQNPQVSEPSHLPRRANSVFRN